MNLGRRKLRNYIRAANQGSRRHVYVFFLSLVVFGLVELYGIRMLRDVAEQITRFTNVPAEHLVPIYHLLNNTALLLFAALLCYAFFAVIFLIIIEQKIGGATVAILAYIEQLRAGNLDYSRELRDGDELKSIMAALHGLAADLKKKDDPGRL